MASTAECKAFLTKMITDNPHIVTKIYGKHFGEKAREKLIEDATQPKKWKRTHKCKPGGGQYEFDEYILFPDNVRAISGGIQKPPVKAGEFVAERGFMLDPDTYDTGVAYVVLENKAGELFLADYIGD